MKDNEFFGFDCYETVNSSEYNSSLTLVDLDIKCYIYDMSPDMPDDDFEISFTVHAEIEWPDEYSSATSINFYAITDIEVPEIYKDNEHLKDYIQKIFKEIQENGEFETKELWCEGGFDGYDYKLKF